MFPTFITLIIIIFTITPMIVCQEIRADAEGLVSMAPRLEIEKMIKLPQEDWMNLMLMGTKVGYAHIYMDKVEYAGEEMIKIRSEMRMMLKRVGLPLDFMRTKESYLDMDFSPRYLVSTSNETGEEKLVEGTINDGVITIRTTLSGDTTEKSKPIPNDVVFEEMLGFIALQRGLKVGDQYTLDVFNTDLLQPVKTTVEVARKDTITYQGEEKHVFVLNYMLDLMGGVTSSEWLDKDGTTYKSEMQIGAMGMKMELVRTDKKTALGEIGEVDVIIQTKIFPQGEPPQFGCPYFKARVYLSEGNEGDLSKTFMQTEQQRITIEESTHSGILEIRTLDIEGQEILALPITDNDFAEFLKSTVYVQSDDESIKQQAKEIIGTETNSWQAAQLICRWVYGKIWNKSLKVGFGSAKQTLESLEGDCTEHTVLFIALARAVGIPSRICAGLVYHRDAFYYHFWPEVYVGKWISMEPTLGQIQADATHIQLAGGKLESESALEFGEGVLRTLNRLQIERIE